MGQHTLFFDLPRCVPRAHCVRTTTWMLKGLWSTFKGMEGVGFVWGPFSRYHGNSTVRSLFAPWVCRIVSYPVCTQTTPGQYNKCCFCNFWNHDILSDPFFRRNREGSTLCCGIIVWLEKGFFCFVAHLGCLNWYPAARFLQCALRKQHQVPVP